MSQYQTDRRLIGLIGCSLIEHLPSFRPLSLSVLLLLRLLFLHSHFSFFRYVTSVPWKKSISYTHRRAFKWFRISLDRCFWPVLTNTIEQFQRVARRQRRRRVPSIFLALLLWQHSTRYSNSLDIFSRIIWRRRNARDVIDRLFLSSSFSSSSPRHHYLSEASVFLYQKKFNGRARI